MYNALRKEQESQYRKQTIARERAWPAQNISFTAFSDSLLVSYPTASEKAIALVCGRASASQVNLARNGLFFRGAMAVGPFLSREDEGWRIAFGPGFLDAYELEKLAVWPRVLLHPALMERIHDRQRFERDNQICLGDESDSGLVYLDYLMTSAMRRVNGVVTGRSESRNALIRLLENHRKAIEDQVTALEMSEGGNGHSLSVLTKYRLLAAYHNRTVDTIAHWNVSADADEGTFSYGTVLLSSLTKRQVRTREDRVRKLLWAGSSRRQFVREVQACKVSP